MFVSFIYARAVYVMKWKVTSARVSTKQMVEQKSEVSIKVLWEAYERPTGR